VTTVTLTGVAAFPRTSFFFARTMASLGVILFVALGEGLGKVWVAEALSVKPRVHVSVVSQAAAATPARWFSGGAMTSTVTIRASPGATTDTDSVPHALVGAFGIGAMRTGDSTGATDASPSLSWPSPSPPRPQTAATPTNRGRHRWHEPRPAASGTKTTTERPQIVGFVPPA